MALTATPVIVQTPKHGMAQIDNADASAQKTVITAGTNGNKVTSLIATSTETASGRDIQVAIVRSATTYVLATTNVPLNAGFAAGVAPVDLLAILKGDGMLARDNDGQDYLFLQSGDTLVVSSLTTVASGKIISVHADHGEF